MESQFFNIVLAVDGSEHSLAAARLIRDLPLPKNTEVTLLGVLTPRRTIGRASLQAALDEALIISLSNKNVDAKSGLLHGHPAEQLTEFAIEHKLDLMVVGAVGLRATLGILLGGVAQQLVEYARWPVLVVRSPYNELQRVLLVTDGSPCSQRAIDYIAQFPFQPNIQLHIMHVLPPPDSPKTYIPATMAGMSRIPPYLQEEELAEIRRRAKAEKQAGKRLLAQAAEEFKASSFEILPVLKCGDAATEILEYAESHKINLIVTGSRGLSAMKGWLLGSVSRKLIYFGKCSVLVIPEQMAA